MRRRHRLEGWKFYSRICLAGVPRDATARWYGRNGMILPSYRRIYGVQSGPDTVRMGRCEASCCRLTATWEQESRRATCEAWRDSTGSDAAVPFKQRAFHERPLVLDWLDGWRGDQRFCHGNRSRARRECRLVKSHRIMVVKRRYGLHPIIHKMRPSKNNHDDNDDNNDDDNDNSFRVKSVRRSV
ncbi:hypothetical protein M430DRAFT_178758 [Amorphotheca resinae ATCC 22711]|jgi:hypothetical protein|uniref:Uncharacterized protein n=1 Tax=Amorphotheca resinae ATCC 22711 TaxID=857342 RepID=A0A2T3ATH1_AMORE|nr:hypothetical protein M430DRAFT_178758 [Amorphotheca resinae ATCC 22711]PSS10752.1 hypothetical protein M430DRAFT_178758 [Amorphotheca resinae ATCC 22711]